MRGVLRSGGCDLVTRDCTCDKPRWRRIERLAKKIVELHRCENMRAPADLIDELESAIYYGKSKRSLPFWVDEEVATKR